LVRAVIHWDSTAGGLTDLGGSITSARHALCPDLLSIRDIGEADGWRGHVVRIFFRILRVVTGL